MPPITENGITIHHQGETRFLELNNRDAGHLMQFAIETENAPRHPRPYPPEQAQAREQRCSKYQQLAKDFGAQIKRLAELDSSDLSLVFALVEVIEFGEGHMCGANWVLEAVKDLLGGVLREGPAGANEADPRGALADLAYDLAEHWSWVDNAREMTERHPTLFLQPPAAPLEARLESQPPASAKARQTPGKREVRNAGA